MDSILPRKYNNKVVIGLGIALIAAVGVAVYLYMREPEKPKVPAPHQPMPIQQKPPQNIETRVGDVKPTLLLIWARWCGWSQKAKPVWDKVATHLSKDGAIDTLDLSDENNQDEITKARPSIPEFKGYPHIRYYPFGYAADKQSIPYTGEMSEDGILKFTYQQFGHM